MILFIRDRDNNTILDAEYYATEGHLELRASVCIEPYSVKLLSIEDVAERVHFISTFDQLQELRGWLWESYFVGRQNTDAEYDNVLTELRAMLKGVANHFNLCYVED